MLIAYFFLLATVALSLALLLWAAFLPTVPTSIFFLLIVATDALLFAADLARPRPPSGLTVLPGESDTFRRHHVYLRYPGGSANLCQVLQGLRWSGLLWVPVLLLKGLWLPALLLVMNFLVTGSLCVRLNSIGPYLLAAQQGNRELGREAERLQSLLQRISML